jgi:hypothetical protein
MGIDQAVRQPTSQCGSVGIAADEMGELLERIAGLIDAKASSFKGSLPVWISSSA